MTVSPPRAAGAGGPGVIVGAVALLVMVPAVLVTAAVVLAGAPGYGGGLNPVRVGVDVLAGRITWTPLATWILVVEVVVTVLVAWLVWRLVRRGGRGRGVDRVAGRLARPGDLKRLTPRGVAASAKRLRPGMDGATAGDDHGVVIGRTVTGGVELRQSWEDMSVDVFGPRQGKTVARVIPGIVAAPGPVIAASRKRDVLDATWDVRQQRGDCWLFDPLGIISEQSQGMWVDLLEPVTSLRAARRLAAHFTATEAGAATDAYFTPKIHDLVGNLLLAAAAADRPITDAHTWAKQPLDDEPADLLRAAGYEWVAASVEATIALAERTRSGVYGGATAALRSLDDKTIAAWLTPPTSPNVRRFRPADFLSGGSDTLYLMSEAGSANPTAIFAAVVDTVYHAGETLARTRPGRRLDPPCVSFLDEVANTCPLHDLPAMFSYLGSAGMPISAYLQSYSRGAQLWGADGMRALWSSANVRVLGGGVADPAFLEDTSRLIGDFDEPTDSVSRSSRSWERTTSTSIRRRRILESSDLAALPEGRAVILPAGGRPALIRTVPWWDGPHADAITASLQRWDPAPGTAAPVADTDLSVDQVDALWRRGQQQ